MTSPDAHARHLVSVLLDHPLRDQRDAAAESLRRLPPAVAEPALTGALSGATLPMRRRVLTVLTSIDAPKGIPALMQYALDRDPTDDTRALALRAILNSLRPRHAPHCFDFFIQLRRDPDPMVRALCLESLGRLADPRARPFLEEAARSDAAADVRNVALNAARALDAAPPPDATAPALFTPERLRELLASRQAEQRTLGITELIRRDPDDALRAFLDALTANHALARESALLGLAKVPSAQSFRTLLSIAQNDLSPANERTLALRALAVTPPPAGAPTQPLLSTLERLIHGAPDLFTRAAALEAYASLNPPADRLSPLLDHLTHPEPWLRETAAQALLPLLSPPHHRHLLPMLAASLRDAAAASQRAFAATRQWDEPSLRLVRLLTQCIAPLIEPGAPSAADLIPALAPLCAHPRADLRDAAQSLLSLCASPPSRLSDAPLSSLLDLLGAPQSMIRDYALALLEHALLIPSPDALRRLSDLTLAEREPHLQRRLLSLLASSRAPQARIALERVANSPAAPARATAQSLLASW
jgi:HEAT repeat protein